MPRVTWAVTFTAYTVLFILMQVELSCDSSLFFHYAANISADAFEDIKVSQSCRASASAFLPVHDQLKSVQDC